jgi:peptidoglycan/LPS O-acetylase OafA/YrhL
VTLFHCRPFADGPVPGGFVGVDVFFVLSAFLISSLLAAEWGRTGSIDVLRFLRRRFIRLTPALLLMLAVYLALAPLIWPTDSPAAINAALAGLYLSDITVALYGAPLHLVHTWSLAVEEHFYLLWPLLFLWLARHPRNRLAVLLVAWLAATAWRLSFIQETVYYYRFDTHLTGLILGAALFFAPRSLFRPWMAWAATAAFAAICLLGQHPRANGVISLAEVAAAAMIGCIVTGEAGSIGTALRQPAVRWVGKISYGIYLWQWPIADYLLSRQFGFWGVLAMSAPGAIALAALSYYTIEKVARRRVTPVHGNVRLSPFSS